MKQIITLTLIFIFFACKSNLKTDQENNLTDNNKESYNKFDLDTLKGIYIGDFDGSDIRIILNFVSDNHVVGYNIYKGLQRNISGKLIENQTEINLELHEPGDHENDGTFFIKFYKSDLSCTGHWEANSKKISKKNFKLEKIKFNNKSLDLQNFSLKDISKENFTEIFYSTSDSIGSLYFDQNGLCRFEYYTSLDTVERAEQMDIVEGSWTINKEKKVVVNWSKNNYFKEQKSIFEIFLDYKNYNYYLKNKERKFTAELFGY